jgi:glucose/arabinose dehydrogenase
MRLLGALFFLPCALLVAMGASAAPATSPAGYLPKSQCAGYPRLAIDAPKGWCVGLVADARDGLKMPRRLLEVAPGRFWIVDMGNWEPRRGRLLELQLGQRPGDAVQLRTLATGLDRPHGIARGPDGKIYIGEAGTVWRTPVEATVQREDVVTQLPDDGAHPLTEMVFGEAGQLFINVGSTSDACRNEQQQLPQPCPETAAPQPRAAVYLAQLGGPGFTLQSLRPYATGLRNSLGLAYVHGKPGRLWQAENSVDYTDARLPAEELNELVDGGHYGWPYCLSEAKAQSVVARGYEGRATCSDQKFRAPFQAWPAHVAPLQLLAVPASAPGSTGTPWSGRLLAVWHGYRANGHRIVAWRLDERGQPTGTRKDLVSGWSSRAGVRPRGTPAGATVDAQGRLWIVEDRNRTVLVVAPIIH